MNTIVQYLEKNGVPEYAVIPVDVYRQLLEQAEDAEDIRAADKAMREIENGEDEIIPSSIVDALINGTKHPLRIWREYRGLTQDVLAKKAGVGKSYISQIETGRREGSVSVYRAIAKALQIDIDDLVEP
jgi:DNA-binding XRE family transcriptional regulator